MRRFASVFLIGVAAWLSIAAPAANASEPPTPLPIPPSRGVASPTTTPTPTGSGTTGAAAPIPNPAPPSRGGAVSVSGVPSAAPPTRGGSPPGAGTPTPTPIPVRRNDQWTTYLHDLQRTSDSLDMTLSVSNAPAITQLGAYKTGGFIAAQAAVVNNAAYFGSWDGNFYALNATTGALLWKQFLGKTSAPGCVPPNAGITSVATVENNTIYVGGGDRYFYALDTATGGVKWRLDTGNNSPTAPDGGHYNWSSPVIIGNDVYIGIASFGDCPLVQGKLLQVDKNSGTPIGEFDVVASNQIGGGIWTTPCYDVRTDSILFTTGTADDTNGFEPNAQALVSLDRTTLATRGAWRIPAAQAVFDSDWGTSCVDDAASGRVFATNKNGILYAFDAGNITAGPVWQSQIAVGGDSPQGDEGSVSTPTVANGVLYASGNQTTINGTFCYSSVRAFNPATGAVQWEYCGSDVTYPALTYVNGLLLFGDGMVLEILDTTNHGALLASFPMGAFIYAPPSIANGVIYLGVTDKKEHVLGLPGSSVHWPAVQLPATNTRPADPKLFPAHR